MEQHWISLTSNIYVYSVDPNTQYNILYLFELPLESNRVLFCSQELESAFDLGFYMVFKNENNYIIVKCKKKLLELFFIEMN